MTKKLFRLRSESFLPDGDAVRSMLAKEALIRRGESEEKAPVSEGLIGASAPRSYVAYSCNCSDSARGFFYVTFSRFPYDHTGTFREEDHAFLTMLASEVVLGRDWSTPEEDEAWADL